MGRNTLLAIDCSYIGHQARLTLPDLSHDDEPTAIIFGFLGRLLSLCERFKTTDVEFCWDSKHSYRREIYAAYKERRRALAPDEREARRVMHIQLRTLRKEILPEIGFGCHRVQWGFEADDHIAAVCNCCLARIVIVSADKDLYQLLGQGSFGARMFQPTTNTVMTADTFRKEYGIDPSTWPAVKAIAGCSSDGVEGIRGVGETSAIKWLANKKRDIKPHIRAKLEADAKKMHDRNLPLVLLPFYHPDYPVVRHYDHSGDSRPKPNAIERVAKRYGFRSMIRRDLPRWEALLP